MINVAVRVNTTGAENVFAAMRQAFAPPMHPAIRAAFQAVADRQDAYIMRHFDRISATGGIGEWRQLRPSTLAEKKRKGQAGGILVATGTLRDSLDPGHPLHVRQQLPNGVRTGSRDRKLPFHQQGAPGRKLPRREVIVPPHPQLVREMVGDLAEGMRKVIAAARAAAPQVPGVSNPPSMN
jgi:hypothetical protein